MLVRVECVGLVDAHIEYVPFDAVNRTFELPVAQDVGHLVAIAQSVESWADAALLADVNSHEAECLVLGTTVLGTSANKGLDRAALGHRACEGLDYSQGVWVLPKSALT